MAQQQGQYDNERRFTLFPNKRKQAGDRKPNYTGTITLDGVDYWLSAWIQEPRAGGAKYLQGVIGEPKDQQQGQGRPQQQRPAQGGGGGQGAGAGANFQHGQQRPQNAPPQNPIGDGPQFNQDDIPF